MDHSNKDLFSQGYNLVPVSREILADLETPLSSFLKLANQPYSFLFESVEGGERWGRYSIIGLPCAERLEVRGLHCTVIRDNKIVLEQEHSSPLEFVEQYRSAFKVPSHSQVPRFFGGLVGYFSYDCVRYVEPKLDIAHGENTVGTPDIILLLAKDVLVFDNLKGTLRLISYCRDQEELARADAHIDQLEMTLRGSIPNEQKSLTPSLHKQTDLVPQAHVAKEDFLANVERVKEYILAGDVMQVVLSQRFSVPFAESGLVLYRALRYLNPSPYMYYLNLGDHEVVGSSPEILVRVEDQQMTVRPIAGTRCRGKDPAEDQRLERELLADPKELAEHLMLIDLGRNDVGRIAQAGTVELTEKMVVERYSHVMHICSNVVGTLASHCKPLDALKAALPAGTLSGAPKIRAMEIIDELEHLRRGVYGGAVGYLAWNGNMDTAIAIRTGIIKNGNLYIQAGAGIVADSDPESEWQETENKAKALLRAAEMAIASASK